MSDPTKIMVYFVGGPQNGTTMFLWPDADEYRFPKQRTLKHLADLGNGGDFRIDRLKVDLYKRIKEMEYRYMRGCWIFEWMGEQ